MCDDGVRQMGNQEGDKRCCVGRDGIRMANCGHGIHVPIWTGAIYRACRRKRDNALIWKRVGSYGSTRSGYTPSAAFLNELNDAAPYPWTNTRIRHNDLVYPEITQEPV